MRSAGNRENFSRDGSVGLQTRALSGERNARRGRWNGAALAAGPFADTLGAAPPSGRAGGQAALPAAALRLLAPRPLSLRPPTRAAAGRGHFTAAREGAGIRVGERARCPLAEARAVAAQCGLQGGRKLWRQAGASSGRVAPFIPSLHSAVTRRWVPGWSLCAAAAFPGCAWLFASVARWGWRRLAHLHTPCHASCSVALSWSRKDGLEKEILSVRLPQIP